MKSRTSNPIVSSIVATSLLGMASSQAAVTLYAEYHLGEAGSLSGTNKLLQDSSVNAKHIDGQIGGNVATVGTSGVYAPGSTAYLDNSMANNQGWFAGTAIYNSGTTLPTDNFAFGIYARAASTSGTVGEVFNLGAATAVGGGTGTFKLTFTASGWQASSHYVAAIGGTGTFVANQWVHLALIRSGGQTGFYFNGVQLGGTINNAPVIGAPYIGMTAGNPANNVFDGHLDEARIVTFTSGESTANILNALTVPEPSAALLGGLGMLSLLRRRRA